MYHQNIGCLWLFLIFLLLGGGRLIPGLIAFFFPFLIFLFIIGLFGASFLKNITIQNYTKSKSNQQRLFVHLLVGILVQVAKADGRLDQREIKVIRQFFQDQLHYNTDQMLWIKDMLKSWSNSSRGVESICEEINVHFGLEPKLVILQLANQVAQADGQISFEEQELIRRIAQLLNISDAFQQSMGARTRAKNKDQYYAALGLPTGASQEEIKKAYRNLVRQYHPDKVRHLGQEFQEQAEHKIREINEAYEVLSK